MAPAVAEVDFLGVDGNVVDVVVGTVVEGFCTLTWKSDFTSAPDPRLPRKT